MADFFQVPFANSGDQTTIPITATDGTVDFTNGFNSAYSLPVTASGSKKVPRTSTNYLFWRLTKAVRVFQVQGSPDWIGTADNGAGATTPYAYPVAARVYYNAKSWRSLIANNTATPGVDVMTTGDNVNYWVDETLPKGPTQGGTGQSSYTIGDIIYASAANVLSKLAGNTTTAREFLLSTGDGTHATAPQYARIQQGDVDGIVPANKGGSGGLSGLLKADGGGNVSQAAPGTDYVLPGLAPAEGIIVMESWSLAPSDESSSLSTGAGKLTWRSPYALTVVAIKASVKTAPTGAPILVDVNRNGVSQFTTELNIDAGTKTSVGSVTPDVLVSNCAFGADDEITIDIDQVGSTIAGVGLKVTIIGHQ